MGEVGKDSQGLYSEGICHIGCCEGDMKYCLSSTEHGADTGGISRSPPGGAGGGRGQKVIQQGSTAEAPAMPSAVLSSAK